MNAQVKSIGRMADLEHWAKRNGPCDVWVSVVAAPPAPPAAGAAQVGLARQRRQPPGNGLVAPDIFVR